MSAAGIRQANRIRARGAERCSMLAILAGMARRALVRVPAQSHEGSAYSAAIEIGAFGRCAEEECLGAGTQFEPAGAIRDGGIAVHQMPAMGQHEAGNFGLKSEVASGVLVDPEPQGRGDEALGALRSEENTSE